MALNNQLIIIVLTSIVESRHQLKKRGVYRKAIRVGKILTSL